MPRLRKAEAVHGANLFLRDVTVADAGFIHALRRDDVKGRYLAPTAPEVQSQVEWLEKYVLSADQAYFIICDAVGTRLGCVRLYDPIGRSFRWGSWLILSGLSPLVAIESILLVYAYASWLGFEEARLDVRRDNKAVWSFHEGFSDAKRIGESELDYFYVISAEQIRTLLKKYAHFLTHPLSVTPKQS
jgi:hypothetical protein